MTGDNAVGPGPAMVWWTDNGSPLAGPGLEEALSAVMSRLASSRESSCSVLTGRSRASVDTALLIRVDPTHLLVTGTGPVAAGASALLASGFAGWAPAPLNEATPVQTLRPHLLVQYLSVLTGYGFTTVEQVRAVPPAAWPQLRRVGTGFRTALPKALTAWAAAGEEEGTGPAS